jgi:polyferredoxin
MLVLVLVLAGVAVFGVFVGYVCGFGLRTRHTQLHAKAQTRRDQLDRHSVGLWETHGQDR